MIKTLVNDTLKTIREMRIANADGTAAQYIGEMYVANEDGTGVEKIFDAGWDTTVTGNVPLSLPNARPKPTSWQINGNSKRSITIDGKEYIVPSDITLLEYIESTGTQYINTGIQANPSCTNTKMNVCLTNTTGTTSLFGSRGGTSSSVKSYNIFGAVSGAGGRFDNVNPSFPYEFTVNTWYAVELGHDGLKGTVTINGALAHTGSQNMENSEVGNIYIGALNSNGTVFSGTPSKWGIVQIWKDGTNISGIFYPAKQNNIIGMYDFVTGTFFTNAGTGTFTAGPALPSPTSPVDVKGVGNSGLPSGYKKLEYIQSSGTQYIDTGVIPDNTTGFKVKMAVPETVSDIFRFGCRQNSNDTRFIIGTMAGSAYLGFGNTLAPIAAGSWAITQNTQFVAQLNYLNDRHAYINDIISSTDPIRDMSETTFTYPLIMFGRNSAGSIASSAQTIYSCEITKGSELVRNFIPAQNASNVVGMYDLVTDTFFTNDGTGDFTAGPEDTSCVVPILQANNCGMVDLGTLDIGKTAYGCSFEKSDMAQTETNAYITGYSLGRGDKTFRIVPVVSTVYVGIQDECFADMTIEQIKELLSGKYLYYQRTTDDTWTPPTTTNLYLPKQLQKVGTYADDATSGGVLTSRVGVKVFDGTEEWQIGQSFTDGTYRTFLYMSFPSVDSATLCSHFEQGQFSDRNQANQGNKFYINTTSIQIRSTQFDSPVSAKSWLAAQYAAGTPVIIYYPLATATETSVTVPSISTARGDNYLDVTTEVKPTASATYRKRTQ